MTSRVSPKRCELRSAVAERELCPGVDCPFWEEGGAVLQPGCGIERLGIPFERQPDLALLLLDLRLSIEAARTELERAGAYRRLSELLNLNRE